MTDFGAEEVPPDDSGRLIPPGLLRVLRENVEANGLGNVEVRHLDWHDFLPQSATGRAPTDPRERFERIIAADVVYYTSDLPALTAALAAHLAPGGRAFVLVPGRVWTGPLAGERATAADLIRALQPFGEVRSNALRGHCGDLEGSPVCIVELVREGAA